jgi:PAS domain-containing protein
MASGAVESLVKEGWGAVDEPFGAKQEPFGSLIPNSTVGVALFDRRLRCRALSPALRAMIGVSTKNPVGKFLHQLFPGEASFLETAFRRVLTTGNSLSTEELTAVSL